MTNERSALSGRLTEMLIPLGTVAIQGLVLALRVRPEPLDATGRPWLLNSCLSLATGSEVALKRWPLHLQPSAQL
jgi:hypothetical protein